MWSVRERIVVGKQIELTNANVGRVVTISWRNLVPSDVFINLLGYCCVIANDDEHWWRVGEFELRVAFSNRVLPRLKIFLVVTIELPQRDLQRIRQDRWLFDARLAFLFGPRPLLAEACFGQTF